MLTSAIPFLMLLTGGSETGAPPGAVEAEIYVDAINGSDSNDGSSPAQAIKTIDYLNSLTLSAGQTIAFEASAGQIHRVPFEGLNPGQSGTSGSPITFREYNGSEARIFGSLDGTAMTWTSLGGNVWKSEPLGYSTDFVKRINQIYTDESPAAGFENSGGTTPKGIECEGVWNNNWTQETSTRWSTPCHNPDSWSWNNLALDGVPQGGPEASISAVNTAGEWIVSGDTLYVGGSNNPGTFYNSVVPCELNSNGDWIYVYDGSDGYVLMYHSVGSPAAQYSYLEIPNCKVAILLNGLQYINLSNLEVRHGCEGVWVGDQFDSNNCTLTNINIRQVCRNGLQIEGDDNTITSTSTAYIERCGTEWHKKPADSSVKRNGHGYHLANGDGNTVENYIIQDIGGEDGVQHAKDNAVGDNNWLRSLTVQRCREDCIDIKDGKANLDNCTIVGKGDGRVRRNAILLQNDCTGLYAEDTLIQTEDAAAGVGTGDCITRESGMSRPITLKRVTLDGHAQARYLVDAKQGSGDVTTEATVWLHKSTSVSAMRLVNGEHSSLNDSAYSAAAGGDALFELRGTGLNSWTNVAAQSTSQRVLDIDNGTMTMANPCIERDDQATDWIDMKGTTVDESDIDGGYSSGGLTVTSPKTEPPDFDDPANGDLTISAGAGAASGGDSGSHPATDRKGNAYSGTEIGAYSTLSSSAFAFFMSLHFILGS